MTLGRMTLLLCCLLLVFSGLAQAQDSLRFMAAGYNVDMVNLMTNQVLPAFEQKHGVKVEFSVVTWGERTDKLRLLIASGLTPDVIGTGYYSPHEEGAQGLFLPLNSYLNNWKYRKSIPQELWRTQTWRGNIYVMPMEIDMRGYAYNKNVFAQAGYHPDRPPQSWTDLVEYSRRLTQLSADGNSVKTRGIGLWGPAGEFMSFVCQAGTLPVELEAFRSNLNKPAAVEAANMWSDLVRASSYQLSGPNSGVAAGAVAMESTTPGSFATYLKQVGGDIASLRSQLGVFYPRKDPQSNPVALAFVNGLAISSASKKADLAWQLIDYLMSDEVQKSIHKAAGWMPPRIELANDFVTNPLLPKAYEAVQHLIAAQLPPPRNTSQGELDTWLNRALRREVTPEQAMSEAHNLWSRLLAEWKTSIDK